MKLVPLFICLLLPFCLSSAHAEDDNIVNVRNGQLKIVGDMGNEKLLFNGKTIYDGSNDTAIGFYDLAPTKYTLGNQDAVLLSTSAGASCDLYHFVTVVSKTKVIVTPAFGTCDDSPKINQEGNKIILVMKNKAGRKEKFVYENGAVIHNGKLVK